MASVVTLVLLYIQYRFMHESLNLMLAQVHLVSHVCIWDIELYEFWSVLAKKYFVVCSLLPGNQVLISKRYRATTRMVVSEGWGQWIQLATYCKIVIVTCTRGTLIFIKCPPPPPPLAVSGTVTAICW